MQYLRSVCALGLCLALTVPALAQDDDGKQPGRQPNVRQPRTPQLIPARQLDALELDEKQQAKVAEIQKAYADEMAKSRDAMLQLRQKGRDLNEDDRAKLRELTTSLIQLRTKYRDKVTEVLNDEQKKKFQNPFGNRIFTRRVTIEQMQRQLNLSDEQKKKLDELRKEFEKKQLEILTDEQKKKFEDLKNRRPGVRPGGRPNIRPIQIQPGKIQIKPIKIQPGKIQPIKPRKVKIQPVQPKDDK